MKTYQLSNSGPWFRSAVRSEAAREWIRESVNNGDDMFVIVGYHTMIDARIVEYAGNSAENSAWLQLPVQEALAAAGVGVLLGSLADPGIQVLNGREKGIERRLVAVGEQVCAVQYRKIHMKWFSSRDLTNTTLEKDNCWKFYWHMRNSQDTSVQTDDAVEVDLQDDSQDLEFELEGDYQREDYGAEKFLF